MSPPGARGAVVSEFLATRFQNTSKTSNTSRKKAQHPEISCNQIAQDKLDRQKTNAPREKNIKIKFNKNSKI
jgi:hypothetical protein